MCLCFFDDRLDTIFLLIMHEKNEYVCIYIHHKVTEFRIDIFILTHTHGQIQPKQINMSSRDIDSVRNALSTGVIVAIVVGSVVGLAVCIGCIIVVLCLVKYANRSRSASRQQVALQPTYPYPHSWATHYPPNTVSVVNHPDAYPSMPPPYTSSASDYVKPLAN